MKKAIVTYAAGSGHEEMLKIAMPGFREFSKRHGYDLIIGKKYTSRPAAWNKVLLLKHCLQAPECEYNAVLWLDCDVVILDPSKDIQVPPEASHALVRHFSGMSEVPNSGVWFLRQLALPLLEKMWSLEAFMNHGWWEQAALLTCMGYTVPPEGSDFGKTKCRCVYPTEWSQTVHFLQVEWNSHPNYRADVPRIVHCSYRDLDLRIETMKRLVADGQYKYPEWPKEK